MISCGIDEVGRGALAGPLVVACVSFNNYKSIPYGIRDSKKTTEKIRKNLVKKIIKNSCIGYSIIPSNIIDEIGIEEATNIAYLESLKKINKKVEIILIDGNLRKTFKQKVYAFPKGDANYVSIAAASIVAKYKRDNIMINLNHRFSRYNWKSNKGYGTKEHLLAIKKYGISDLHRKTYEPIKSMIK